MRIGILINPQARRACAPSLPERLEALCRDAGCHAEVVVTRSPSEVAGAVAQLVASRVDVLAPCGGDGTLLSTVTALVRAAVEGALPKLLLLPGGTMNTVAKNLGAYGPPEERLQALLRRAGSGRGLAAVPHFPQQLMRLVTFDETPAPRAAASGAVSLPLVERYGFLFTAAMGARFLTAYSQRPGLAAAVWLALRTVLSSLVPGGGELARWLFQPTPARITVDGEELPAQGHRVLLAATVPDVGLGMQVPWRGGLVPRRFQLIASALPLWKNALQLPRLFRGQPLLGQPHQDRMAQAAHIRFEQPQPLSLDGELFSARAVELSLGPVVDVLCPAGP
jgi:diacylglycerol kinase family enzyme